MIKINLLPEGLKKQRVIIPKVPLAACGLILIVVLFFWYINVNSAFVQRKKELKGLEGRWQKIEILSRELGKHERALKILEERTKIIGYLMTDRILWSKKLNELSDLMIDNTWLSGLKFDKNVLVIEGNVYSENKDEEAIVGNFMLDIKNHNSFFEDFSDIELRITRRQMGDIEYISFIVFCALKEKDLLR